MGLQLDLFHRINVPSDVKARFFAKTTLCTINGVQHLLWTGRSRDGYGAFYWQGTDYRAHRFAWLIAHGSLPKNHCLHLNMCHMPICIMIEHLYDGTDKDNVADALKLGTHITLQREWQTTKSRGLIGRKLPTSTRQKMSEAMRGINHPSVKLSEQQVILIRARRAQGESLASLSSEFGVTMAAICRIDKRQTWKHLP